MFWWNRSVTLSHCSVFIHKPFTSDSVGFFFSSDCPIYKRKAVSLKNLFYFNHLIHLVCGWVQKPPAVSAACFGEGCVRTSLQKGSGRVWQTGCQGHGVVTSALPGPGGAMAPEADGQPLAAQEQQEKHRAALQERCDCVCRTAQVVLVHLCWSTKPQLAFGAWEERDPNSLWWGNIHFSDVCVQRGLKHSGNIAENCTRCLSPYFLKAMKGIIEYQINNFCSWLLSFL